MSYKKDFVNDTVGNVVALLFILALIGFLIALLWNVVRSVNLGFLFLSIFFLMTSVYCIFVTYIKVTDGYSWYKFKKQEEYFKHYDGLRYDAAVERAFQYNNQRTVTVRRTSPQCYLVSNHHANISAVMVYQDYH